MTVRFRLFPLCLFLCIWGCLPPPARPAESVASAVSFAMAAAPAWVQPLASEPPPSADPASDGISYLLVDQQENLEPRASYYHEARQITSENGVQNGAAIAVTFDPSYQKLIFHSIRLIREGVAADRLNRSQIKLLQREREMESFLYDGSFTAQCHLEDVRVGDVIEYAYTIEGANPVLKGKYFETFATEWASPVHHAIARMVYPAGRKLKLTIKNRMVQTAVATTRGTTEWRWEEKEIPARRIDPNTPRGYAPYGRVEVTEFADWQQVAAWAVPLYQTAAPLSADLEKQIAKLRAIENPEERILAALRFVQDEIRYLGLESGMGSHQPTAPSEVLRRRFGDCKDKTLLLGTLLRQAGLTATPALVSSAYRSGVADRLPSPGCFNHVILQVETGTGTHWLDATRTYQRGPLSQIHVGNYGYALVLRPETRELTAYAPPPGSLPKKKIVEKYRIPAPGGDARLEVVSEFHGAAADIARAYFQTSTKEDIRKNYLQYYARRFPRIQSTLPVEYEELAGGLGCRVKEQYLIPGIWEMTDNQTQHKLTLYPTDVDQEMGNPGAAIRNDPLALNHPANVSQEIQAEMFENWLMNADQRDVANAFFHFQSESKAIGSKVQMNYSYQSLVDQVSPADLSTYDTALRKLKDSLGFVFTYSTPEQLIAAKQKDPNSGYGQFNWPIAVLFVVLLAAIIPLSIRYCYASKLAGPLPPSLTHRSLEGIGGWLILVALGLLIRPLNFIYANVQIFPTIFRLDSWRTLTHVGAPAYHPYWMPTLLFELIYNSMALIFSGLLLVLFFKKRAAWPRGFIAFFIFLITGLVVDYCLGLQIPAVAAALGASAKALVQTIFAAAIWIPYCLTSKRVKATFRY